MIGAQSTNRAQPGRNLQRGLTVGADQRLAHVIFARGRRDATGHTAEQPDTSAVVAQRSAELAARVKATYDVTDRVARVDAVDAAFVALLELVPVGGSFQCVGEVGVEIEPVAQCVDRNKAAADRAVSTPFA